MNIPADLLQSKEWWSACVQALATISAVCMAYHFGLKQLRKQTQIQLQQDLRRRKADALHAAWGLLQCLTEAENGENLLRYVQTKAGGTQAPDTSLIASGNPLHPVENPYFAKNLEICARN